MSNNLMFEEIMYLSLFICIVSISILMIVISIYIIYNIVNTFFDR